jgi:predicted RNA-binding Zn-ribbon protein involved in translation (DUF1610 family)
MGEIADSILEGELCQECGVYMGEGDGYPRSCSACSRPAPKAAPVGHARCPECGKRVKAVGLADHRRDAHTSKE